MQPRAHRMGSPCTHIAFALKDGIVHLCLDSCDAADAKATSLCRDHSLEAPRAPVAQDDLSNIQNFIICKGCEARFNLLGYRAHYAPALAESTQHPAQLALF